MTDNLRPPEGREPDRTPQVPEEPPRGDTGATGLPPMTGQRPGFGAGAMGLGSDAWDGWFGRLVIPVQESKGWLKFMGVVLIASGILTALTLVGIIVAWLYIWLGVLLWQAGERANQAVQLREPVMLEQYLQKIKTVAVIAGVTTAVSIVLSVFAFIITLALGWTATWMEMMNY